MEVPAKLSVTFFPGSGNATMTTIPTLRKKMEPKSGRAKVIVWEEWSLRSVQQGDQERGWRFPDPQIPSGVDPILQNSLEVDLPSPRNEWTSFIQSQIPSRLQSGDKEAEIKFWDIYQESRDFPDGPVAKIPSS